MLEAFFNERLRSKSAHQVLLLCALRGRLYSFGSSLELFMSFLDLVLCKGCVCSTLNFVLDNTDCLLNRLNTPIA